MNVNAATAVAERRNKMAKELSPKQKKIAKVAGNPNKIEGKDFMALKKGKSSKLTGKKK